MYIKQALTIHNFAYLVKRDRVNKVTFSEAAIVSENRVIEPGKPESSSTLIYVRYVRQICMLFTYLKAVLPYTNLSNI